MARSGIRMATWAMCAGLFLAHALGPSVGNAADLYVSGALLNFGPEPRFKRLVYSNKRR